MNAATRLGIFALILAIVFVAAFVIAGFLVPGGVVEAWLDQATTTTHAH